MQAGAGIEMHAKPGDPVREGDLLLTLHTDEPDRFDRAQDALQGAITIAPEGTTVGRTPDRHRPDRLTHSSRLRAACTRFSHPRPCENRV